MDIGEANHDVVLRYQSALGRFVNDFAMMENFLFNLLCVAANIEKDLGKALFSGKRADGLILSIRNCYAVKNINIEPFLKSALSQAQTLNGIRNKVVHYATMGMEDDDDHVWVSNMFRHPDTKSEELHLTPDTLDQMSSDSRVIIAHLCTAEAEIKDPGSCRAITHAMNQQGNRWQFKGIAI